ncbi:AraC family transcriptional regulator [Herbiconiux sp. CPCC 205763]|uniref:AraC family transcriptional regulator n=1 Tax=Herbiconiux aconitum TaxID=2970913 RepID=A0ABT2GR92_9MICO|nr:AraC family transcriptional regulator [Herbiconiux aconitum]MCS5718738.1 AraC family transcriptional regulator [Herbiconiux aconitum]
MDSMSALLDRSRAAGAFILRSVLSAPWAMRIEDDAPLTVLVLTQGRAWIVPDDGDPVLVEPGDVVLLRGPGHRYTVADDPLSEIDVVIDRQQNPSYRPGVQWKFLTELGVRTWGNEPEGSTLMLTGTYQVQGEVSETLLCLLPSIVVVPLDESSEPLVRLLADEIARDRAGQETVLDRLLDLLLIGAVRTWFSDPAHDSGWFRAQDDPVVGPALRLLHDDPAHPWTISALASRVGVSRATFARRFTDLVGRPPMAYLVEWRLKLAADLLRETRQTLGAVASAAGYGTPFALSAAFRRERGESPRDYRSRMARHEDGGVPSTRP